MISIYWKLNNKSIVSIYFVVIYVLSIIGYYGRALSILIIIHSGFYLINKKNNVLGLYNECILYNIR